jgi:hypothetical protein
MHSGSSLFGLLTRRSTGKVSSHAEGQGFNRPRASLLRIKPSCMCLGRKDHRHPIMERRDQIVGRAGDDRAGPHHSVIRARLPPALPQPRKGERRLIFPPDQERLAQLALLLPFKEAIGRH